MWVEETPPTTSVPSEGPAADAKTELGGAGPGGWVPPTPASESLPMPGLLAAEFRRLWRPFCGCGSTVLAHRRCLSFTASSSLGKKYSCTGGVLSEST